MGRDWPLTFFSFLLLLVVPAFAAAPTDAERNVLTPEQILDLRLPSDVRLSPDARTAAFVITEPSTIDSQDKPGKTNIWTIRTDGNGPLQILPGSSGGDTSPRWSPDGKWLAFLSTRNPENLSEAGQLYVMAFENGQPICLTHVPEGVQQFRWSPDNKTIAFTTLDPNPKSPKNDDAVVVDDPRYMRLWNVTIQDHSVSQITRQDLQIYDFDWSPDGSELVLSAAPSPSEDQAWHLSLVVIRRSTGEVVRTLTSDVTSDASPKWSPDGRFISFLAPTPRKVPAWLAIVPATGGNIRLLQKDLRGTILAAEWSANSKQLIAEAAEGTQEALLAIDIESGSAQKITDLLNGPEFTSSFSISHGTIAYFDQTERSPNDVWVKEANASARKLTDLNPQTKSWPMGDVRTVNWTSSKDGTALNGVLITPAGFNSGAPYPTVVVAHPGWIAWWTGFHAIWWDWGQLLASHGYAVFMPNYRGAWGQGWKLFDTIADWGGMSLTDLNDGVDYLVREKITDPNRLGITGWSNGGFVAALTITQNQRFKAAVLDAPVTDFFACLALPSCAFLRYHLGADPYMNRSVYDQHSPITYVRNCHTSTLLIQGEADDAVPLAQSQEFYRGLKNFGIPAEMVVYPREGHPILERAHQLDLQRRALDWFDRYLKR